MAEAPSPENPWEIFWFIGGILLVLFVLWWVRGGPEQAKMSGQGLFISPTAPLQNNSAIPQ
jgi:hypothetical protein